MPDHPTIRVPDDFEREFPGAVSSATEVTANLLDTATALTGQIERCSREAADLSVSAFQTLAILDGAAGPLTSRDIAERLLVSSASMTSLLDTLERRGLVERHRHPTDRRMVEIHLTTEAQVIVDQVLPAIHTTIAAAIADVPERDRPRLVRSLNAIRGRVAELADGELPRPKGPRRRRRGR